MLYNFIYSLSNVLVCSLPFYDMLFSGDAPVEEYERSWEQNEELGLNDIDTSSADAAYNLTDTAVKERFEG